MGAERFMIVNEESMHDADGPHEVDSQIIPVYDAIDKENRIRLEELAAHLNENFDGHYVVISHTQYWELKNN